MANSLGFPWKICSLACLVFFLALSFLPFSAVAGVYVQTNLVSDGFVPAKSTDPSLVNPWGISYSAASPFWVSNNGTGLATLYNGAGQPFPVAGPLVITIPPPSGGPGPSAPTGQVSNGTADFLLSPGSPARVIFATEDGTISGWNPSVNPTAALLKVDNSISAVYTGLALGNNGSANFLYAANFSAGTIDVFDTNFAPAFLSGSFTDPNLPSGFAPFNIQNLGGSLFVTYAQHNGSNGVGQGYVTVFDLNGNLLRRLISQGPLNSPWGLALAPAQFGTFSNNLLLANFGDGRINAFDPLSGNFLGALGDVNGNPIVIEGLRSLIFGNGGKGGDPNKLYFTAGIGGAQHGLFGSLAPAPPITAQYLLLLLD
jgi:uncharacterized protein (TIGR03118 family)